MSGLALLSYGITNRQTYPARYIFLCDFIFIQTVFTGYLYFSYPPQSPNLEVSFTLIMFMLSKKLF